MYYISFQTKGGSEKSQLLKVSSIVYGQRCSSSGYCRILIIPGIKSAEVGATATEIRKLFIKIELAEVESCSTI